MLAYEILQNCLSFDLRLTNSLFQVYANIDLTHINRNIQILNIIKNVYK